MRHPRRLLLVLAVGLAMAVPLSAQEEHAATAGEIDALVAERVSEEREARSTLYEFLQTPDVREAAEEAGIDLRRAESAVASLDDDDAMMLAERANQLDETLAGAQDRIVISTTAIIIVLLVLIIILVS